MTKYLYHLFSVLAFISFVLLFVAIGKDAIHTNELAAKRPQTPETELGLTIPFNVGRRTVYVSQGGS